MTPRKKVIIALLTTAGLVLLCIMLFFGVVYYAWNVGIDEVRSGLQEGIQRSEASDSPVELPSNATNIYYAYELYWQGGASIARYHYPHGDIKIQAATHFREEAPWVEINSKTRPIVPEHRFTTHTWFQPTSIATGYESATEGILWEPKVWIDETSRTIYVLDQN